MVATDKLTAEDFWARYGDSETCYELVRGQVVDAVPHSSLHGDIAALISSSVASFVRQHELAQHHLGRVKVEAHYRLGEHTLRVPDVSFVSAEHQAQIGDPTKFVPFAPDLAIEIISPSETHTAVRDKIEDYRAAGTAVMWLVYPDTRSVDVHDLQAGRIVRFGPQDTLTLEAVLPGFSLALKQIFPD